MPFIHFKKPNLSIINPKIIIKVSTHILSAGPQIALRINFDWFLKPHRPQCKSSSTSLLFFVASRGKKNKNKKAAPVVEISIRVSRPD